MQTVSCRLVSGIAAFAAAFALPATSFAQSADAQSADVETMSAEADGLAPLSWEPRWGDPGWVEAGVATAGIGGSIAIQTLWGTPQTRWEGPIGFDQGVQDAIGSESSSTIQTWASISNFPYWALTVYPVIIDSGLVAWLLRDSPEVARKTALISLQSLAVAGFTTMLTLRATARERPAYPDAACGPDSPLDCDEREALSFPSGHTALAFTGASLICTHHSELPLYGGGLWDTAACVLGMGAASLNAVGRLVSHKHYASDVLVGSAIGLASGLLLPRIYYGFGDDDDDLSDDSLATGMTLVPMAVNEGRGMALDVRW